VGSTVSIGIPVEVSIGVDVGIESSCSQVGRSTGRTSESDGRASTSRASTERRLSRSL
jgi:hypothetical protein